MAKRESGKCIWLITYAACSPNITHEMLHGVGIACDECHTTLWRESKYTLIHLNRLKRVRPSMMNKAMSKMEAEFSIKASCIVGYETLARNTKEDSIQDHPGFRRMIELLNNSDSNLESWTQYGDVRTHRKGLLWKHIEETAPQAMTRTQLIRRVELIGPLMEETERIKTENEDLKMIAALRTTELEIATHHISLLTAHYKELLNTLADKTDECATFRQRLIQNNINHEWVKRPRTIE